MIRFIANQRQRVYYALEWDNPHPNRCSADFLFLQLNIEGGKRLSDACKFRARPKLADDDARQWI